MASVPPTNREREAYTPCTHPEVYHRRYTLRYTLRYTTVGTPWVYTTLYIPPCHTLGITPCIYLPVTPWVYLLS